MAQIIQFPAKSFACETPDNTVWSYGKQDLVQQLGFCDWISMSQRHTGPLKKFNDGAILIADRDGVVNKVVLKRERFEGSYESAIMLRCDGETVEFSGNVSKFNRQDNVFGLPFGECLEKINTILAGAGLPPFTAGERFVSNYKGDIRIRWTGAKLTRLDITENYSAGSKEDAAFFMRFLQGQQAGRIKTGTYGDGETVDFGRGSRRLYFKVYTKAAELRRHGKSEYIGKLADWADSVGLVRAELTLKSLKLADLGCAYLGEVNMSRIENEFSAKCEVFTRANAEVESLPSLPSAVTGTLRMWESGDDLVAKLPKSTFYRHRAILLSHGVDIAIKSDVVRMKMRTRVITLGPAVAPSFYEHERLEA